MPYSAGYRDDFTPAGEFPFVNHGFGRGQKGALGILVVEP